MKNLKERKPLLIKLLAVILLILMCCNLPSLLFWPLCLKEDLFRPPNTEVLVSACKKPVAIGIPGGEALFVYEDRTEKTYLLDLRTGEKKDVPDDSLLLDKGVFLSSELVWLEGSYTQPGTSGYRPHYILDLINGQRYELLDLGWLPRLDDYTFDINNYSYFQPADQVFIHHSKNVLIALSSDFRKDIEERVVISQYVLESGLDAEHGMVLEQLMKDLNFSYETIDFSLRYVDAPSPMRKYIVRNDGVYLSKTNTLIVRRDMGFYFRGWYYDESGVVFQEPGYFLISGALTGSHFPFPRPILKLYLTTP